MKVKAKDMAEMAKSKPGRDAFLRRKIKVKVHRSRPVKGGKSRRPRYGARS